MAYTEFCCRSGGSNLNAGTRTGNSTVPGTAADLTYASGSWNSPTGVFTVASGDPAADGVAVGDFASVYADGSTVTGFVGRVTARDATTITVSLTAVAGTPPGSGAARTLKIGGAWAGPNGTENFPFGFVDNTLTNSAGDLPRVNFKDDATYSVTAAITHGNQACSFEGFTTSYADGGRATIDGGSAGASYVLVTVSAGCRFHDFILQNNGATGSATGLSAGSSTHIHNVTVLNMRGIGISAGNGGVVVKCEVYNCNTSNTSNLAGISGGSAFTVFVRCTSHGNSGSNGNGFTGSANGGSYFIECLAFNNGGNGFHAVGRAQPCFMLRCDSYDNAGDGLRVDTNTSNGGCITARDCNFVLNGGYGVNDSEASIVHSVLLSNCGFGTGTAANTSGTVGGNTQWITEEDSVSYAANATPWQDPANGDFRIALAAAQGDGSGNFLITQGGYSGAANTVGYPDRGAVQHQDAGGGGGTVNLLRGKIG